MIFPQLRSTRFGYLNLDLWAQQLASEDPQSKFREKSPMLNATIATHAVEKYHKQMSIDWSYGDWMATARKIAFCS